MGLDVLVDVANGDIIDQDDPNTIHRVLEGDFVGRDSSGAPTAGQNLGTIAIPWGTAWITSLILDGFPIEPGLVTAPPNRVISGAIRTSSEFPAYLEPAGSGNGNSFTVLATTTTLTIDVNGIRAEADADIVKSGLTLAPATNNTCLVNDTTLTGQDDSRFLGENGSEISVDNMGSELTSKIGEFAALLNQTTGEILYCQIISSGRLGFARRGLCFDNNLDPIPADALNNNDTLQLLSLGFIFLENDGSTVDVTYSNPVISGDEPTSPSTGDYWYDLNVNKWKRYTGSSWLQINRTYIGAAVIDTADCIGVRPEYFSKAYADTNTLSVLLESADVAISSKPDFLISIDGSDKKFDFGFFDWDASTDFESGFTRTASRNYWLYLTEDGKPIISGYKPYDVLGFLRGWYHPYESWRAIGQVYNNASNEFEIVNADDSTLESLETQSILGRVIISNNAATPLFDIDSTQGKYILDDGSAEGIAPAFTKKINATWAKGSGNGGNPGLTLTANTTYHYFLLTNAAGNVFDYGFDSSLTAANLLAYSPVINAGLTKIAFQGSVVLDGSIQILPFLQTERWFEWIPRVSDISAISFAGRLTSDPYGALVGLTVPVGYKVKSRVNVIVRSTAGPASLREAFFRDPDIGAIGPAPQTADPLSPNANFYNFVAEGGDSRTAELDVSTDSSGQIVEQWFQGAIAGVYSLLTMGYVNLRLKECI